jgi:hypothetical protein
MDVKPGRFPPKFPWFLLLGPTLVRAIDYRREDGYFEWHPTPRRFPAVKHGDSPGMSNWKKKEE